MGRHQAPAEGLGGLVQLHVQLALQRKEETVTRMVFSIGGALIILLGATVVLALLHPAVPLLA